MMVTCASEITAALLSVMVPVMPALACAKAIRDVNSAKQVIAHPRAKEIRRIRNEGWRLASF
jgi:hypothetical protein